ncbi:MAG TPA: hypothetical protein VGK73_08575 [Polyangiaceae bacterium]
MHNGKRLGMAVMLAGAVLATAGGAQAGKTAYPGLICVEQGDATPEITYQFFGAVRNDGPAQWLLCPIDRSNVSASMDVTDWDITTDRRGAAAAWDVTLWSTDTAGANGFASTITVAAAPATGVLDSDGGTITTAVLDGTMFVETFVPAGAELRRISVNES